MSYLDTSTVIISPDLARRRAWWSEQIRTQEAHGPRKGTDWGPRPPITVGQLRKEQACSPSS